MRKNWLTILRDITIIFVLSLTPLLWFRQGMLFVGHDLVAPLNPQIFFTGRLFTWINQFFGQSQALILGTIPIHFLDAIPSYLGFSLETVQKIVYVWWFFLMGVSAYVLAHVLRPKSSIFKLTATILYQFNFFILQAWWIAEKSKFSAYIAAPLVLSVFLLVESDNISVLAGAVLNSLILFFFNAGGVYGLPLYGGFFVILGSFILFSLIEYWYQKNFVRVKKIIVLTLSTLVLGLAINAYFVLPAALEIRAHQSPDVGQIGGVSGVLSWAGEISANTSFLNLVRLEGIPDWYDNPEHPYAKAFLTNPLLVTVSFLWPLAAFATLYIVKDRKSRRLIFYLFLVYLIGIFFTAGTHPPLGFLYQILVERIPGFFIFRTPYYKFASALFFANAFLLAFLIDSIPKKVRTGIFVFFFAGVLSYHYPYFQGNFFEWRKGFSTRLAVPLYVFEFGNWLNKEGTNSRVLMVPPDSPDLQYGLYQWGYLSFQALPTLLSNNSAVINNDKLNSREQTLTIALYNALLQGDGGTAKTLISALGISHVVLAHDAFTTITSSIPLDVPLYEQGVNKTGLFSLEKRFGQWDVYGLKEPTTQKFYIVQNPAIVDSSIENAVLFARQLQAKDFLLAKDIGDTSKIGVGQSVIVPDCLTCPKQNGSEVVIPSRNILPGDPFYGLVLLSERLKGLPKNPREAIYNMLGITLKRVGEIYQMTLEKKPLTTEVVGTYINLLSAIGDSFQQLTTVSDKFEVASDIHQYLHAERNLLLVHAGASDNFGSQLILSGNVFSALAKLDALLQPYVSLIEDPTTRSYQFNLATSSAYAFFVPADNLKNFSNNITSVHLTVDNSADLKAGISDDRPGWVSFGNLDMTAGSHILKLSLPKLVETTYPLQPIGAEFSQMEGNNCFGTAVSGLKHENLYGIHLKYLNNFSDDLILFVWERTLNGKPRLLFAENLLQTSHEDTNDQVVKLSTDANAMTISVCAQNLTSKNVAEQFTVTLSDIIYPQMVVSSQKNQTEIVDGVSYKAENPIRYVVSLPQNIQFPTLLVFSERFDPWWELKGASARHIMVNGYANGWVITSPANEPIIVDYRGQKYFYWGIVISIMVFGGGIAFFLLRRSR